MPEEKCGCGCACDTGVDEWPEADRGKMRVLIGSGIGMLGVGGYAVARSKPRWLPLWLAALVTWFTLCKYLICTRCENYGKACDFYYLGILASMMFKPQTDKTLDTAGMVAEGGSVAVLQFLPLLATLRRPRLLLLFLASLAANQAAQISICCRRCVQYSRDPWKRDNCPSYKLASGIFSE